ncbi:hypothetical protein GF312_07100 [Candidatus Poribacteria bacterium]|nr:hypothetical protein [Candidatus Poribacteria bacterium]
MPIHDQSYKHWEKKFKPHTFRWWVITKEGLRIILRRKLFLLFILGPPAILMFVYGAMIYGINIYGKLFDFDIVNSNFFFVFFTNQNFFISLICVFGGSGLIADDMKNNALQMYFSKPLTRWDYLLGKFATIMVMMLFITLVPGILLFVENALISEGSTFIKEQYWLLGSIILYSLVITVPTGLLILALSSISKNSRYAAISFIAILIGTPIFSETTRNIFDIGAARYISYWTNLFAVGRKLFRLSLNYQWEWSAIIIISLVIFCFCLVYRRINGIDIVK